MSKSILSSIVFKNIKNVKRDASVEALFKFLYVNLYFENEETFNFNKFVKIGLCKDKEDFQKRLANFSVIKISYESREQLAQIKMMDFSTNSKNLDLFRLLEWMEFNYEAFLVLKEKE